MDDPSHYNFVVCGLKSVGMQKMLIIREPFVVKNCTNRVYWLKLTKEEEKICYRLNPGSEFPVNAKLFDHKISFYMGDVKNQDSSMQSADLLSATVGGVRNEA